MVGSEVTTEDGTRHHMPKLVGGRLCLEFANTIGGRGGTPREEFLGNYSDLVTWAQYADVLTDAEAQLLRTKARTAPNVAAAAFQRAIELRETIYRVFSTIVRHQLPETTDLEAVRLAYVQALNHAQFKRAGTAFSWTWTEDSDDFNRVLWPIARSAVELLTSGDLTRLKECPGGGSGPCTWLFIDTSKNQVRRWCSMEDCGNAAKARRQTARRRAARAHRSA